MCRHISLAMLIVCFSLIFCTEANARSIQITKVIGNCTNPQISPTTIVIACADHSSYVDSLVWTNFGADEPLGQGTFHVNDCTPDCVSGHWYAFPNSEVLLANTVWVPRLGPLYSNIRLSYWFGPRRVHHQYELPTAVPF